MRPRDQEVKDIDVPPCVECSNFFACQSKKMSCADFSLYVNGIKRSESRTPTKKRFNALFSDLDD